MRRPSVLSALVLLGWLVLCPLASAGVFAPCHDDEAAMDCCLPHEGSGAQPLAKVMTAAALPLALVAVVEPLAAAAESATPCLEPPRTPSGPRLHSLLSVFLV